MTEPRAMADGVAEPSDAANKRALSGGRRDEADGEGGRSVLTVALAGNPNSGKTTVFNSITGARQHVANYPGVTVETKHGQVRAAGRTLRVVDLPGTYSLTARSVEEIIARNFIIDESPDVVVDIVDASNLERNLYLATQLLELGVPMVLAFNMYDVAASHGFHIDVRRLSDLLGVPIVPTVGHKGEGISELLQAAAQAGSEHESAVAAQHYPDYGSEIEPHVRELTKNIVTECGQPRHARWYAVKLIENDPETIKRLSALCPQALESICAMADRIRTHLRRIFGESAEIILAERRYGFISGACSEALRRTVESRRILSDSIDAVLTNRWLGFPIFAALMYLVFQLTFTIGEVPMGWLESGFDWLSGAVGRMWAEGSGGPLRSLLVDGVIGGVGGVLVFLPNILLLFLAIAFLEGTGYMARAAFIMDKLMHKLGLHGKSFIPMLIGFGCSVPAIMGTRTLETRRDRLTTMLVVPLMSCSARLAIYALIIPAFFPASWRAPMLWTIYFIGILLAVGCAKLLRVTVLRGRTVPFVMELPPYRLPTLRGLLIHMWERSWLYLRKAGTIILAVSVVLWALGRWPGLPADRAAQFEHDRAAIRADASLTEAPQDERIAEINVAQTKEALEHSLIGRLGKGLELVLRPCGFDWKISTAMIGAFAAKEVFVAQMGIVYSLGEEADEQSEPLRAKLQAAYTPLQGFCIMLFCLISAPCVATIAVTRRESNSWRWALLQLVGLTVLAWTLTTAVYQVGRLIV